MDTKAGSGKELRDVTMSELQKHNSPTDCWVAIAGFVYDLTDFASEHPAGAQSIHDLAGKDGTDAFQTVHNMGLLEDFDDDRIGPLVAEDLTEKVSSSDRTISLHELQHHNTVDDCWVAFHGEVYDMTSFAKTHPGGSFHIQNLAGSDGTGQFQSHHKKGKLKLVKDDRVGTLAEY
jgi:cytochrome b involved in lipid metabolism